MASKNPPAMPAPMPDEGPDRPESGLAGALSWDEGGIEGGILSEDLPPCNSH